jgi:hypothetical protein
VPENDKDNVGLTASDGKLGKVTTGDSTDQSSVASPVYRNDRRYDGIWAESSEENALFVIDGDSIINIDHLEKFFFRISADSMFVAYSGFEAVFLIKRFTGDSLILATEEQELRLYKR